ncbi:hypothetical protein D3C80_890270 [compost metagenome]
MSVDFVPLKAEASSPKSFNGSMFFIGFIKLALILSLLVVQFSTVLKGFKLPPVVISL